MNVAETAQRVRDGEIRATQLVDAALAEVAVRSCRHGHLLRLREHALNGEGAGWDAYQRYSTAVVKLLKPRGATTSDPLHELARCDRAHDAEPDRTAPGLHEFSRRSRARRDVSNTSER